MIGKGSKDSVNFMASNAVGWNGGNRVQYNETKWNNSEIDER